MPTNKPKSPSTIRLAIAERGHRVHNLWYVWSYKHRRSFVLPSDPALYHWALLEADSTVASYELEAPSLTTEIDGVSVTTRFDATVHFKDGHIAWDEVKSQSSKTDIRQELQLKAQAQLAAFNSVQYRLFTLAELQPQLNRVWNCLRMLQVLRAANQFSVADARTRVIPCLVGGVKTIGELRTLAPGDQGLNLAAIFGLVLEAAATIDLDSAPLTDHSTVKLIGGRHA